ncbi:peptidylprolyl isomerase [Acidiferrobacter sp.]|uniref:peptidylprolyl isomerase n=1 Tax=Acidiferrobacter sp. TaxID=1872107 RepID=UPI00260420CF|nr:peptidylprolyl isomerase [Acidiferrobacter sp.]
MSAALLEATPVATSPVTIDKIVAVVNNEVITQSQLDRRVSALIKQLAGRDVTVPPRHLLARKVLSQMVLQRLELQYAHNIGIRVSRAQVMQAEASLAARNHMTVPQFEQAVLSQGLTLTGFRRQLRTEITIRTLIMRRIARSVIVTRRAVDRFLAQARAAAGTRYRVAEITLQIPVAADTSMRQAVGKRARRILKKIQAGESFSQAAIAYSQDTHALEGGDIGWRTAAHLRPDFVRALRRMKVGAVRLVAGHGAFYIIKLRGRHAGAQGPEHEQVRLREIVLRPSRRMTVSLVHEKLKAYKARLAQGAPFKTLARAYSQGSTAARGGSLGWVTVSGLPPVLAEAARTLPLHAVGGPYAVPQGEALIEVTARRMRAGMTRNEARRLLRMRKGNALYVRWLQTLRDDAYVRYPGRS